jgi:hypothetical protein
MKRLERHQWLVFAGAAFLLLVASAHSVPRVVLAELFDSGS